MATCPLGGKSAPVQRHCLIQMNVPRFSSADTPLIPADEECPLLARLRVGPWLYDQTRACGQTDEGSNPRCPAQQLCVMSGVWLVSEPQGPGVYSGGETAAHLTEML